MGASGSGQAIGELGWRGLLAAEVDDLRDALTFLLHGHLPVTQSVSFFRDLIGIGLNALGVMGADFFHLFLEAAVLTRFPGFEILQLLALCGLV
jgi:hypothetical protein